MCVVCILVLHGDHICVFLCAVCCVKFENLSRFCVTAACAILSNCLKTEKTEVRMRL